MRSNDHNQPSMLSRFLIVACCLISTLLPTCLWASTTPTQKATISNIHISWNDQPKAIEKNIQNAVQGMLDDYADKHLIPSLPILIYETKQTIKGAIAPYGYFSPGVRIHEQTIDHAYQLTATITLHKPVIIRQVHWHMLATNPADPAMDQLANTIPLKKGETLNTTVYNNFKSALLAKSSDRGYFDAHLTKNLITINRRAHWADIDLTFDPGKRYRINNISIHNSYLSQGFLNRFNRIKNGAWFDSSQLSELQQNLQATHYFSLVNVDTHIHHKTHLVDVDIQLKLGDRYHYTAGIGYGTDTKARATLGVSITPFNRRGHNVNISTKLGQSHTIVNAVYSIPGRDPVNTQYNIFTRLYQTDVNHIGTSTATTYGVTTNHVYHVKSWLDATQTIQLYHLNEHSQILNGPLAGPMRNVAMFVGGITYTLTPPSITDLTRNHSFLFSLSMIGAHKGLQSPISFTQYVTNFQYLQKLGENWRLLLGNQWGYTHSSTLNMVPFSLQLLTGGSDSIRGYDYQSIGPGSKLFVGNIELQRQIKPKWYLGVFYDVASVSNQFFKPLIPGVGPNLLQSVGPSLTRTTPIGSISISAAKPLHDPAHRGWSLQFNWGQTL